MLTWNQYKNINKYTILHFSILTLLNAVCISHLRTSQFKLVTGQGHRSRCSLRLDVWSQPLYVQTPNHLFPWSNLFLLLKSLFDHGPFPSNNQTLNFPWDCSPSLSLNHCPSVSVLHDFSLTCNCSS